MSNAYRASIPPATSRCPSAPHISTHAYVVHGMTSATCTRTIAALLHRQQPIVDVCVSFPGNLVVTASGNVDVDQLVVSELRGIGMVAVPAPDPIPANTNPPPLPQEQRVTYSVHLAFETEQRAREAVDILDVAPEVVSAHMLPVVEEYCALSTSLYSSEKALPRVVRVFTPVKLCIPPLLSEYSYRILSACDPLITGELPPSRVFSQQAQFYRRRFLLSLAPTLSVALITLLFSRTPSAVAHALHAHIGHSAVQLRDVVAFILATPVQFGTAACFYRAAFLALKHRRLNDEFTVVLVSSISYVYSCVHPVVNTFRKANSQSLVSDRTLFEVAALLITIALFGKWIEARANRATAMSVDRLLSITPSAVSLVTTCPHTKSQVEQQVHPGLVTPGDLIRIEPGDIFPLDAILTEDAEINEELLTGESSSAKKAKGDLVYAGTQNGISAVMILCESGREDSLLEKMAQVVKKGHLKRAPIEFKVDRLSAIFATTVIVLAVLVTVLWLLLVREHVVPEKWTEQSGQVLFSLLFGLSVLVLSCRCVFALSTSTIIMMATSVAAKREGILFRDGGAALQRMQEADVILFDKVSTLTTKKARVLDKLMLKVDKYKEVRLPDLRAGDDKNISAEICSRILAMENICHTREAKALATDVDAYLSTLSQCSDSCSLPFEGFTETVAETPYVIESGSVTDAGTWAIFSDGARVTMGKSDWVMRHEQYDGEDDQPYNAAQLSIDAGQKIMLWEGLGLSVTLVRVRYTNGESSAAIFCIRENLRPEISLVMDYFRAHKVRIGLVTSENGGIAHAAARSLRIPPLRVHPGNSGARKVGIVEDYLRNYKSVVFVGDAMTAKSALNAATVGVALSCGSNISCESAGVQLIHSDVKGVMVAHQLARATIMRIRWNLVWAFVFYLTALPLAAGAAFPLWHFQIPPYLIAITVVLASTVVAYNSISLAWFFTPEYQTMEGEYRPGASSLRALFRSFTENRKRPNGRSE